MAASFSPPPVGVVVFAHRPPPWHGQSMMVGLMLDLATRGPALDSGVSSAPRLCLHHVDARLSRSLRDVGEFRLAKVPRLLGYCAQALWMRWRHRARVLYYVPAPPARTPVLRDWIVMALCRPFFPRLVLHWHAGGLSDWVRTRASRLQQTLTRRLLGRPDLSLVLRPYHRRDGEYFGSRRVVILPNGVPDPCPDFESSLRETREARAQTRQRLLSAGDAAPAASEGEPFEGVYRVLYLSLCKREKGLFDALDAVALANRELANRRLRIALTVAGDFASGGDRQQFEQRIREPDLAGAASAVRYVGFVEGAAKDALLRESDCLCLPTCLPEGIPITLVEAMAYGIALLTTTSFDLQEVLPDGYPGAVRAHAPAELAAKLIELAARPYDPGLRAHYLAHYTEAHFARALEQALASLPP